VALLDNLFLKLSTLDIGEMDKKINLGKEISENE